MNEDQDRISRLVNWRIEISPKCIHYPSIFNFLFLVLVSVSGFGCFDSKQKRTKDWLTFHQLAQMPKSATNLMLYQWNGLGTGETYISFQIQSNDLAAFTTNSPGLAEGKLELFNAAHQYLPYPANATNQFELDKLDRSHSYFRRRSMVPDWFDTTITNRGRKYILQRGPNSEVYINEETSKVYLRSIKG